MRGCSFKVRLYNTWKDEQEIYILPQFSISWYDTPTLFPEFCVAFLCFKVYSVYDWK